MTFQRRPRAGTCVSASDPTQSGTGAGRSLTRLPPSLSGRARQEPQQQHRAPAAHACGRRRSGRRSERASRREKPANTSGSDQSASRPLRTAPGRGSASSCLPARARPQAARDVVRPDGAVVVAQRLYLASATDIVRMPQPDHNAGSRSCRAIVDPLVANDPAPEQVAHVRAEESTGRLSASRASAKYPPRSSSQNASSKRLRRSAASASSRAASDSSPHASRATSASADLRVVDVALHLGRRDRRFGQRAVGEALRVAGVLPRLVDEARGVRRRTRRSRRRRGRRTGRSTPAPGAPVSKRFASSASPVQRHVSERSTRKSGVASTVP